METATPQFDPVKYKNTTHDQWQTARFDAGRLHHRCTGVRPEVGAIPLRGPGSRATGAQSVGGVNAPALGGLTPGTRLRGC